VNIMKTIYALLLLLFAPALAFADLKVTTKNTAGGHTTGSTIYIKGSRQRTEGAGVVSIYQCDLKRILQLNDRTRKYLVTRLEGGSGAAATTGGGPRPEPTQPQQHGAVVTTTVTVTDTGERRQMFGRTARHVKTLTVTDAPPSSCNPGHTEMETDGWYIDLSLDFNCGGEGTGREAAPGGAGGCRDEVRYVHKGSARLGFPVLLTSTFKLGGDERPADEEEAAMMSRMMTTTLEVTDISNAALDAALFEVPEGYTPTDTPAELYSGVGPFGTGGRPGVSGDERPVEVERPTAVDRPAQARVGAGVPAKGEGVMRIGVMALGDRRGRGRVSGSMRIQLASAFAGTGVEALLLSAADPVTAGAEARQADCDFILYTDLAALNQQGTDKAAGKIGGIFGRVTGVGVPAGKRYEARVEFRLIASDGRMVLQSAETSAGDNEASSISAALQKEAQAVVAAARGRN
jgi:hypothetical protein